MSLFDTALTASTLAILWILYVYTILPELRIFSGFDTAGTAVMWKDTSSIGNILGLCTAGYIIAIYVGSTLFGRLYSHAVRVLAALKYILSILPVSSEIHVH